MILGTIRNPTNSEDLRKKVKKLRFFCSEPCWRFITQGYRCVRCLQTLYIQKLCFWWLFLIFSGQTVFFLMKFSNIPPDCSILPTPCVDSSVRTFVRNLREYHQKSHCSTRKYKKQSSGTQFLSVQCLWAPYATISFRYEPSTRFTTNK